ncbi:hypothetical protein ACFQE1_12135 [Halobium palmae]|uniref:Uncharacterized protein n=1 Tax=Halobium palmae TaxID=1776492 RepID=A0ABD5S0C9_9EURY
MDKTVDEPVPPKERLVEYRVADGRVELERVGRAPSVGVALVAKPDLYPA